MSSKRNQTIPNQTKSVATLHKYTKCIPKPLYPWDVDNIHPNFWDFYTFCTRFQKKTLNLNLQRQGGKKVVSPFTSWIPKELQDSFSENLSKIVSWCSFEAICVEHSKQCPEFSWDPRPLKFSDLKDQLWTIPKWCGNPVLSDFCVPWEGKYTCTKITKNEAKFFWCKKNLLKGKKNVFLAKSSKD